MASTDPSHAGPQFGPAEPGVVYRERPAAFGVVEKGGRLACVVITRPERTYCDLPGGALDPGEDDTQALIREFGEETGLVVRPVALLGRARQRFRMVDGVPVNNLCAVFEAQAVAADPALKIEDDHALEWLEPLEAIASLRHDAHAWAVAAWLRAGPAAPRRGAL